MNFIKFWKGVALITIIATIVLHCIDIDEQMKNRIFYMLIMRNACRAFIFYFTFTFYKIIFIGLFRGIKSILHSIVNFFFSSYSSYKSNNALKDEELNKLEKITILKHQGALTNEEFEEQKEKIMKKYR